MRTSTSIALAASLALAVPVPGRAQGEAAEFRTVRDASGHEYSAESARVRVPENRNKADSSSIELAFVRVKSSASEPGPPIVFLNGGPGQPATPIADDPQELEHWAPLLALADVVFLDQRGTGRSLPSLGLAFDESLPEEFFLDREAALAFVLDAEGRCKRHFEEQGIDLSAYNTVENADDVDALRAALGVERIDLVGFSYGTVLGLTVLRRHPEGVRRAVLIGSEAPEDWGSLETTLQVQIGKLSRLAAEDPGVNHAVPDLEQLLERVLKELESHPLIVEVLDQRTGETVTLPLGRFGLELLLRIDLGDGNDFPLFPALLWTIEQGRTDLVRTLVEKRYNQLARGASAMASTMRQSYGPADWLLTRFAAERGLCLFHEVVNYFDLDVRALWNIPMRADIQAPFVCAVPSLFVSGTLDSNAPPYQAEKARYGFLDSVHLVVENAGHEDLLPDPDVRGVMRRFLAGEDVRDARVALPRPRFVAIRKRP